MNLFCISLTYPYLWLRRKYLRSEIKTNEFVLYFAHLSVSLQQILEPSKANMNNITDPTPCPSP